MRRIGKWAVTVMVLLSMAAVFTGCNKEEDPAKPAPPKDHPAH